jgi:hypothetical protein
MKGCDGWLIHGEARILHCLGALGSHPQTYKIVGFECKCIAYFDATYLGALIQS